MMKTKVILIMMFVAAGFVAPGWAEFSTVGVYDPFDAPHYNEADQSCAYNSSTGDADASNVIDLAYMKAAIIAAFDPNMGGVVDVGTTRSFDTNLNGQRVIRARYGSGQSKKLDIINLLPVGGPRTQDDDVETPISGLYSIGMDSSLGFHFQMGDITGGLEGEKVIIFGGTMCEEIDDPAGIFATATFSDGSTVTATASVGTNGIASDQDAFFGFIADPNEYITHIRVSTPGYWGDMDDLGFVTSTDFPPSSNAGPDQTGVQLYDASGAGLTLAGSVDLAEDGENYTYAWSGGFTGGTTTGATPTVYFTATGVYVLTLTVTGDINGELDSDTVTIEVVESASNAGSNQTVPLGDAMSPGVTLAGSVDDPYPAENYTYNWSGGFVGGTTTGATPTVTFTATGDYVLTLNVTGDVQGALAPDTVTIHVVVPVLDAGNDVSVEKTIAAYPGVRLDSTIIDPNNGETYTYAWTCVPSNGVTITDADEADPVVDFPAVVQVYELTLNVTGSQDTVLVDTVTVNVTEDHVMVAHFAIDPNNYDDENYWDSSIEGEPNNHVFITHTIGGSGETDGVVDCGDDDAISNSNNPPLIVQLDHSIGGFNDAAPHLDNLSASITVAFWIKNDYGRKVWAIEKVGSFAFGIDDMGDLRTKLWFEGAGDPNVLVKSRDGDGLGDDLENNDLKINADGDSGGGQEVWHHIAFTYDSFTGYVEQFLDGALIREEFVDGGLLATDPNVLAIGKNITDFGDSVVGLRGAMDDIRIYNYPLDYHEIAGLASMAEASTLVSAGDDVTVDPNELPYELDGKYIRLAQVGRDEKAVSPGNEDNEYYVVWEDISSDPNFPAIFSDPGDPESDVTFTKPGTYTLRLVSFDRLCGSDNESRSEMEITVLPATDCAGVIALGGGDVADLDEDCVVSLPDLAALAAKWGQAAP
ncbi:MAG: hypothetical protein DRP65_10605 [Planctomycetota bacterium]|nr:MAG: hypothetical protein DRP65_10605 [Planctomycetota bacterium]